MMFQAGYLLTLCVVSLPCSMADPGLWGELKQMERGAFAKEVSDWVLGNPVKADELISPIFMLRHSKEQLAKFEQTLWEVSTPGHQRYGQHLTRTEVRKQLPPVPGAEEAVTSWLSHYGIKKVDVGPTGDMIEVSITAEVAEKMFSTKLHHFKHRTGRSVIRAITPIFVPKNIQEKLYIVGNLLYLPDLTSVLEVPLEEAESESSADLKTNPWRDCDGCSSFLVETIQPAVLRAAYNFGITQHFPDEVLQKVSMAVAGFGSTAYDDTDLHMYDRLCHLNGAVKVDKVLGPMSASICDISLFGYCLEALLDIEVIRAVAGGQIPLSFVNSKEYSYLKFLKMFDELELLPHTISISYGRDEIQEDSFEYMEAVNVQFMKIGVRGASVLIASGDQGVYGRTGPGDEVFHPYFPAESPYVTSVGGTDFLNDGVIGEEKAWSGSGGGFSNVFKAAPYQSKAIESFITQSDAAGKLPDRSLWNLTGRGYPDLAALGGEQNPYCIQMTYHRGASGTSAACPVVAGLIARINTQRVEKGLPPMGFLNPFIYQNGDVFNDVKVGMNNGMGVHGFEAISGWDPATGFGSPNFAKLSAAAMVAIKFSGIAQLDVEQPPSSNRFLLLVCLTAPLSLAFGVIYRHCKQKSEPEGYIGIE